MNAAADPGAQLHALASRLYPICRSITGRGVRDSLAIIRELIPLSIHEVPTGTRVFDWEVPLEWNVEDAVLLDSEGQRIVDFHAHNLHLVSYSPAGRYRRRAASRRDTRSGSNRRADRVGGVDGASARGAGRHGSVLRSHPWSWSFR